MTLKEQIKAILESGEIAQNQLAKEIGLTGPALSSYLRDKYTGDNQRITGALEDWLEKREEKRNNLVQAPDFVETATAQQILATLGYAHLFGTITTVYGMSGAGKTTAAREYKKTHANVWMVTAKPSRATLNEILFEMALELGLSDCPKRKGMLSRVIAKKLNGTKGLFIVDEADHLPYEALEELRLLQEESQVGFVLIGNDKVYNRMRGASHQSHEFARLWSRIAKNTSIQSCKKADVLAIAKAWNLDTEDRKVMGLLGEIGKRGGGLRSLTQTLRLAWMNAKSKNERLNYDFILNAKMELQGGNV